MAEKNDSSETDAIDLQLKELVSEINGNFQRQSSVEKVSLDGQQDFRGSFSPTHSLTLEPSIKGLSDNLQDASKANTSYNANTLESLGSPKHQLVVTSTGLVKQEYVQIPMEVGIAQEVSIKQDDKVKEPTVVDEASPVAENVMVQKSPLSDSKTFEIEESESEQRSLTSNSIIKENEVKKEKYLGSIVPNDTSDLMMTLSDNMEVGSYEIIEPPQNDEEPTPKYRVAGFSALNGSISPVRKSVRPPKKKIVQDYEDYTSLSATEKQPPKKRAKMLEVLDPTKQTKKAAAKKSKAENLGADETEQTKPANKKKLRVDDVYESGDGLEEEDDINRDILKVRMLKCNNCEKHFLDRAKLNKHKKEMHKTRPAESKKEYICEECGYVFQRREHWRRHKEVHSVSKPYTCSVCDRAFKRLEHVKRHQSVHSDVKPFPCEHCPKKFTRRDHLAKHNLMHTGQANPFAKKKKEPKMIKTKARGRKRITIQLKEPSQGREQFDSSIVEGERQYGDDDEDDDEIAELLSSDEENHSLTVEQSNNDLEKIY